MKVFFCLIAVVSFGYNQKIICQTTSTNELINATKQNDLIKVGELVQKGVSVNIPAESGLTPLMYAVKNENLEMVKLLIKHGAKINQTYGVQTALYLSDYGNYINEQSSNQKIIADYLITQALKGLNKIPKTSDIRNAIAERVQKKWDKKSVVQLHQVFPKTPSENSIRVLCSAAIWDKLTMYEVISFKGHVMAEPLGTNIATHSATANSGTKELIFQPTSTGNWTVVNQYDVGDLTEESSDTKSSTINITSTDPQAINKQGHAHFQREEYDIAIQYFSKAIELKPNLSNPYFNRGSCYGEKGNLELAIQDYTKAIELSPNDLKSYYSRGHCYSKKGDYTLAFEDYKRVRNIKSDLGDAYILVLPLLIRLNRLPEANAWYESYKSQGLTSFIERPEWKYYQYYIQAATSSLYNDKYREALELLKTSEREYTAYYLKNPKGNPAAKKDFPNVLALKGYVLEKLNLKEQAKAAYQQALRLNAIQPDVKEALLKLQK
jgi:tetratricopeptide (TPR) repeat protein